MKLMILVLLLLGVVGAGTAAAANPVVVMETSMGTIKIELFEDKAPITVKNFLGYVDDKFYDGTLFHRVMPNFMIQGGGFEPGMKEKSTKGQIKNEWKNGLKNERGAIAMARRSDPDTASAQFFFNVVENKGLDTPTPRSGNAAYCVFGKVMEGMDVVDKIKAVRTADRGGHESVPVDDVVIKSVRRADKK